MRRSLQMALRRCSGLQASASRSASSRAYERFAEPEASSSTRALLAGTLLFGGAIYVTHREPVPGNSARRALHLFSVERERQMGEREFEKLMKAFGNSVLPAEHTSTRRVRRIALRLLEEVKPGPALGPLSHLQGTRWKFVVVDSPVVNAFALPSGAVVVFTGLLRLFPRDDELAVVLGHEIAHVVARHSGELLSSQVLSLLAKLTISLSLGGSGGGLTDVMVDAALHLPHSRAAECEADALGLKMSTRACYCPDAAPRVFEKLRMAQGSAAQGIPAFLSTHPSSTERVRAMEKELPAAQKQYDLHGCPPTVRQGAFTRSRELIRRYEQH